MQIQTLSSLLIVLLGFTFISSFLDYHAFAQNLNVSAADSEASKIQKEKAEEERKKAEEQRKSSEKQKLEEEKPVKLKIMKETKN